MTDSLLGGELLGATQASAGGAMPQTASLLSCEAHTSAIRWRQGERLEQLFEQCCDALHQQGRGDSLAVDGPNAVLTYAELDARANQLARYLAFRQGVRPGDRVGLLFDRAIDAYVGMLAVLKARAAYVPLDATFPAERLSYIVSDAGVRIVLSRSHQAENLTSLDEVRVVCLDAVAKQVGRERNDRLGGEEIGIAIDDLCYLIYTSGTTGQPKGVAISHASIVNFVRVAAEVYGIHREDRVYQGLTIAFDFSIEEIWVAWMATATLVPKPTSATLLGDELHAFLTDHRVTALCCVPTLLATLDEELPNLRFLLVSGEPCPQHLVTRWHRAGRRFLNVYGPTEATVSATWTLLHPDKPVTIGVPLPTYSVVVLDPEVDRAVPVGQMGEIGIAGVGLAEGYLNRPKLTARAFVPDFLSLPNNPSERIYRTGDVGRINAHGEVEHHGRIDTQIKVRGYRVELSEIESVLLDLPAVAQAVVGTYQPEPDLEELVAYYNPRADAGPVDAGRIYEQLSDKLPAYMVPAYLEQLAEIPTMPSGKVDRKSLPAPRGPRRLAAHNGYVAPASDVEFLLADHIANILGVDQVSVDSHFFDDLGANSLLMARFNAAIRRTADRLPPVSMRDVYRHPTVRRLAAALSDKAPAGEPAPAPEPSDPQAMPAIGTPRYALCGAVQLLVFLALLAVGARAFDFGSAWITATHGPLSIYARAVAFGTGVLLALGLFPLAAKWILIGRWQRQRIRVWSIPYLRFWFVKTLVVWNPLVHLVVGTPLYSLYLRALGARVGRRALILTHHIPLCTDLVSIGTDCVIRKDTFLNGYRACGGVIETGPISVGDNAFVGERAVLDIDSTVENDAQLGHSSSLHSRQVVPRGRCWHGSPAEHAGSEYDYRRVTPLTGNPLRAARYAAGRLLLVFALAAPVEAIVGSLLITRPPVLDHIPELYAPIIAAAIVFGLLLAGVVVAGTVPRLLTRALAPGKVYPLYGIHYALQRFIAEISNLTSLNLLFGDSSAIVPYLQLLGYRFGVIEQTGSNFGTELKQEVPALSEVGTGTMASDGLSMMNAEFSSSSFRVVPATIGKRNYLGNDICYPAEARIGENCLLATKVLVPVAGAVRHDVGLLGSPCFEIPRSVERDGKFAHLGTGRERHRRLAAKLRHNVITMGLHLSAGVLTMLGLVLIALLPFGDRGLGHWGGMVARSILDLAVLVGVSVFVERAVTGFRPLQPKFCSIYQRAFWQHERYWKVSSSDAYLHLFDGTPFKPSIWRLLGVRIGRRVFDDGCAITERTLVSLGSDCTLNMGSILQSHTLEDAIFKSDHITVGDGCTVGTAGFVNYGVVVDERSVIDADSFVMKGSYISRGARWRGNPATEREAMPAPVSCGRELQAP